MSRQHIEGNNIQESVQSYFHKKTSTIMVRSVYIE